MQAKARPSIFGALVAALFLFSAGETDAACANQCSLTVDQPLVTPPLECLQVTLLEASDCACRVVLDVTNGCSSAILAEDFTFGRCDDSDQASCTEVPPNDDRSIDIFLTETGTKDWTFAVDADGAKHSITVTTHVDSFEEDGCAIRNSRSAGPSAFGASCVVAGAALAFRLRRKGQSPS